MSATLPKRFGTGLPVALGVLALAAVVAAAEPVGVLTELRAGTGEIRVRRSGASEWSVPQPLLTLRPGDEIRVTGDGRAVVAFTGGGLQTVSASNSPFVVQAPRGQSGSETMRETLVAVVQFLLGQQKELRYEALSVRGGPTPVRIISPRDTRLLPGPVIFEWTGPPSLHYRIQVQSPQGPVWEASGLPRRPIEYPASAPPLHPGLRHTWALEAPGRPVERASFEIVPTSEASRIQAALTEVRSAPNSPPNTVVLMRAALLFREGLYSDARRELLAGLTRDAGEPTFHVLLGRVYERIGLPDQASQAFDEATVLSTPSP